MKEGTKQSRPRRPIFPVFIETTTLGDCFDRHLRWWPGSRTSYHQVEGLHREALPPAPDSAAEPPVHAALPDSHMFLPDSHLQHTLMKKLMIKMLHVPCEIRPINTLLICENGTNIS